jgi:hypothetical protein
MNSMMASSSPLRPGIAIISITSASDLASLIGFFAACLGILDDVDLCR